MKTVTINVTMTHINMARHTIPVPNKYWVGLGDNACRCPIDYAVFDVLGPGYITGVTDVERVRPRRELPLPEEAQAFVNTYDFGGYLQNAQLWYARKEQEANRQKTKPFSFELEVPDDV